MGENWAPGDFECVSPHQFVEPVPEDYQCHICLMAARDAVVTEQCGHLFCQEVSLPTIFQPNNAIVWKCI